MNQSASEYLLYPAVSHCIPPPRKWDMDKNTLQAGGRAVVNFNLSYILLLLIKTAVQ